MISEEEIVQGCKAGSRKSQRLLYDRYSKKMLGVCLRYCQNREEAEDVLQDGFIKVFTNIDSFKEQGSFEGWIRRIMVNTAINNYQSNLKRYYHSDVEEETGISSDQVDAFNKLSAMDLLRIIQSLPEGYRMVFNMYAIEGYTHKEIGEMLGISENTSKSQLSRARVCLQKKAQELNLVDFAIKN
jgi:RNA polymerase sigma factor (sigma-70 family)